MTALVYNGGGQRGYMSAILTAQIESHFGKISENFDVIIGTSTGAILASALAGAEPVDTKKIIELYEKKGQAIFSKTFVQKIKSGFGLFDAKYSNKILKEELEKNILGNLSDSKLRLLITAYDIERRQNIIFDSQTAKENTNFDYKITDCVLASSAAPTYFEPFKVQNVPKNYVLAAVDGGVAGMNNPVTVLLGKLLSEGHKAEDIKIVEIGTGSYEVPILYEKARNWGLAKWAKPVIDILLDGTSELMSDFASQILQPENYLRIQRKITDKEVAKMDNAKPENILKLRELAGVLSENELEKIEYICRKKT